MNSWERPATRPRRVIHQQLQSKECLAAGYDTVYTVFIDEQLLQRTRSALSQAISQEEAKKVRLLPVSNLSQVGNDASSLRIVSAPPLL